MSLGEGSILGSSTFGSPPLSDIDELNFFTPAGVYHRWQMQSSITHTTNDIKTAFSFAVPADITGDCMINIHLTRVSICTAGTFSGSVFATRGNILVNRNATTWTTASSWPGTNYISYIDVSSGISGMSTPVPTVSGNTFSYRLTGLASQTIVSKVLAHIQIVSTP